MDFNTNDGFTHPQLNNIHFQMPSAPPLTQRKDVDENAFCNVTNFAKGLCRTQPCSCTHMINLKYGEVIELVMINEGEFALLCVEMIDC